MLSRNLKFLLERRGSDVTLNKFSYGGYDPSISESVSSSSVSYTTKGYFAEYMLSEINNDSVQIGDRRLLLGVVDNSGTSLPEPDEEDTVDGRGDTVVIKSVQKLFNADTLVCYICQVRE